MKVFTAKKRSFLNWGISVCSPILGIILIIFFADLFNKNMPWWALILLTIPAIFLSLFLFWIGLDFCSTIILDDKGIKITNPVKTEQFNWFEIKEALITKPGDSLELRPKNENEEPIYYPLSMLSHENQEKIQEVLKEKTRLRIKELPADLLLPQVNCSDWPYW